MVAMSGACAASGGESGDHAGAGGTVPGREPRPLRPGCAVRGIMDRIMAACAACGILIIMPGGIAPRSIVGSA